MAAEDRPDIWKVADRLQMNLRACAAQLVELRSMLAGLDLPEPADVRCPFCGIKCRGPRTLEEHLYLSHDQEVPASWERAAELSE